MYSPTSHYRPPHQLPRRSRRSPLRHAKKVLLFGCLVLVFLLALHFVLSPTGSAERHAKKTRTPFQQQQAINTMNNQLNQLVDSDPPVDISVTVIDLNTNQTHSYGPAVPYEAASVGKLITATDLLHQTETGTQNLHETLEDGHSASYDLRQMIVQSDNNAWQSLNDQLTLDSLSNYATSVGISDYNLNDNALQTSDIALLLAKLYRGQLLDKTNTQLLLGYMKIANEADYIPPVVPKDAAVYHKAGLLDDRVHDAAIIDDGHTPIVLVIFTNGHGTYDFTTRTQIIQSITKTVLTGYDIT